MWSIWWANGAVLWRRGTFHLGNSFEWGDSLAWGRSAGGGNPALGFLGKSLAQPRGPGRDRTLPSA